MSLDVLRLEIDKIDKTIIDAVTDRMRIAGDIAKYKKENNLPILDAKREREKLLAITDATDDDMKAYMRVLYSLMFELSRSYQTTLNNPAPKLFDEITDAIENTPRLFPESCSVACQGVEGANSTTACERMFKSPRIVYMKDFESVFSAVESGLCRYGVIPLENTTAGSVNKVYDLMVSKKFTIVRSTRIKIEHNLLANRGAKLSDIREIFSHEQAISQSAKFLATLDGVKVTACANTAVAAEMVAKSGSPHVAALASYTCAELYGLDCLVRGVQDNDNNHTRFICISRNLEIYPGADRTSIMMVLPHKPGSLYKALARLYALGINLRKLESRPIPERDFEFMFYFDLETSIYSGEFVRLICELDSICEEFRYLGSYTEIM